MAGHTFGATICGVRPGVSGLNVRLVGCPEGRRRRNHDQSATTWTEAGARRTRCTADAAEGWPIGSYFTYAEAQRAVDYLSDQEFPVQQVTIVGVDLMQVERVTGDG